MPGKSFRIALPEPIAGQTEAIDKILVEESVDGLTGWVELMPAIAVADLAVDQSGKLRLDAPLANRAAYHRLIPFTASGVERQAAVVYPPLPTDPESFTVFVWSTDLGLGIKEGVAFEAKMKAGRAASGGRVIIENAKTQTDANGYAALPLYADAGVLRLTIGPVTKDIDSSGRAGQVINLIDLL